MSDIRHDGIIESIGADGHVSVRITQSSACASCKIAGHCNASEQKEKVVDVYLCAPEARRHSVGDSVVVSTSQSSAGRALLLGFGLPLVLLLAVLAALTAAGMGEGTSALAALAVLAPYYLIIWLCRDRIAGSIRFHIEGRGGNAAGAAAEAQPQPAEKQY